MVRFIALVIALVIAVVSITFGSTKDAWSFGEVDILLRKEVRVESSRTNLRAVKERNLRMISELNTVLQEKQDSEIYQTRQRFGEISQKIGDQGTARRSEMNRSLRSFVLKFADSPSIAQVYLRLAELYYTEANDKFASDMDEFEKALDSGNNTLLDSMEEPDLDYSKVIELYEEFIELFPEHPFMREALYLLGYTLDDSYREDEAAEMWQRLIALDPRGPLAPEARFRYGEYLFLDAEMELAVEQYKLVVESGDDAFFW